MNAQSSPKLTSIERIRKSFKKVAKYFVELIPFFTQKHIPKSKAGVNDGDNAKAPEFINLMEDDSFVDFLKNHELLRLLILDVSNRFWHGGWRDGKIAQRKTEIYEIAKNKAFIIQDEIKATYNGEVAQLETENDLKKGIYQHAAEDYDLHKDYQKLVTDRYRANPRNFSAFLAILYLTIAILLIFADIPLALKLTQTGFDLDSGAVAIKYLFVSPWKVFQENWEVFVLAFGVALCTIYIKIYYDEFLGKPLAKSITQFKELKKEGVLEEEIKKVKQIHFGRVIFKTMILFLAIGTIFMLGLFRFETIEYKNQLDQITQKESFESDLKILLDEQTEPKQDANVQVTHLNNDNLRKRITQITFILITLLFPIVGGICASIGLNLWHNRRELKISKKLLEKSKLDHLVANRGFKNSKKTMENKKHILEWAKGRDFILHCTKLFLNYYNHGYQRGLMEPIDINNDKDMFDRAEELRNKLAARKAYENLQGIITDTSIDFDKIIEKEFG